MRHRESFDSVASLYDEYRLPYPPKVVDDVITSSRLSGGGRVLEIGCGSGQLSLPLAEHGVDLIAIELGPRLADLARQKLAPFPNVEVVTSTFEAWPLPAQKFDAVVCASAFHWLDPEVRFAKSAEALRAGGSLTVLHVHQVSGGTPGFVDATQPYYMRWGLSDDPSFQLPAAGEVPPTYPELDLLPYFSSVERHRFEIPRTLSTSAQIGWLSTDSLILGLNDESRRGFLRDLERLIDSQYGGKVSRNWLYEVVVARKVP
ncbi:MAG: methyltransferase domain-containing protein [Candidatus Dormibacteraeota bacterium]|nr:methyltransferase domain-containing protein [Candidatus Dormibacteraeota bacterium]